MSRGRRAAVMEPLTEGHALVAVGDHRTYFAHVDQPVVIAGPGKAVMPWCKVKHHLGRRKNQNDVDVVSSVEG